MPDHFSILDESRRPWLDPEALKQKFHALSAEVHPDRVHGASEADKRAANDRYMALNAAYQCLREPRDRLAHLVELERGARPNVIQNIPPELMDIFFDVGRRLKESDAFLAGKAAETSPLLKVQFFARSQMVGARLEEARRTLTERQAALDDELRQLDRDWNKPADGVARTDSLDRLEEIYRLLSYFSRWSSQLQERMVQLTLS